MYLWYACVPLREPLRHVQNCWPSWRPQSRTKTGNRSPVLSIRGFPKTNHITTSRKPGALSNPFSGQFYIPFPKTTSSKVGSTRPLWRFDRTLTPQRSCHAPASSVHVLSPLACSLVPLSPTCPSFCLYYRKITTLPSQRCPILMANA